MSPRPRARAGDIPPAPPLPALAGKVLGLRVQWDNFELLLQHILRDERIFGGMADVRWWKTAPEKGRHTRTDAAHRLAQFEEFASGVDAVILGLAA